MAEGKQQVKLIISNVCDLSFATERMRFTHSWHLLPQKYRTKSPINFNVNWVWGLWLEVSLLNLPEQIVQKAIWKEGSTTFCVIQTLNCFTQNIFFYSKLYYESLKHWLVEGGILFHSIFPANLFLKLVSARYSVTQFASFSKDYFKRSPFPES